MNDLLKKELELILNNAEPGELLETLKNLVRNNLNAATTLIQVYRDSSDNGKLPGEE